jgi:hypothetical protein
VPRENIEATCIVYLDDPLSEFNNEMRGVVKEWVMIIRFPGRKLRLKGKDGQVRCKDGHFFTIGRISCLVVNSYLKSQA